MLDKAIYRHVPNWDGGLLVLIGEGIGKLPQVVIQIPEVDQVPWKATVQERHKYLEKHPYDEKKCM